MDMLRHRKSTEGKKPDRLNAAKKPGKTGRFARRAGLVAGITLGIIAPSLLKSQSPGPAPDDKRNEITLASASNSLPANTYTVPATDGKDTLTHYYANANAKKKAEVEPGSPPEQRWCEGIAIENGKLIFKGISAHGKTGSASVDISKWLKVAGLTDVTTENIKWHEFRIINGEKKAYFVIETESISVLMSSNPDFEKGDDTWGKAVCATDRTKILRNPGAVFVTEDGTIVATTPTTLLMIQTGIDGKKFSRTYKEMFGEDVDNLKNPRFSGSATNDVVELRDETFVTQLGNKVVITIPIYNWDGISASVEERFTKN